MGPRSERIRSLLSAVACMQAEITEHVIVSGN